MCLFLPFKQITPRTPAPPLPPSSLHPPRLKILLILGFMLDSSWQSQFAIKWVYEFVSGAVFLFDSPPPSRPRVPSLHSASVLSSLPRQCHSFLVTARALPVWGISQNFIARTLPYSKILAASLMFSIAVLAGNECNGRIK